MLLYHFNFGFPLLGPGERVSGPSRRPSPATRRRARTGAWRSASPSRSPSRVRGEGVLPHAGGTEGREDIHRPRQPGHGDGEPLGIVMRWNQQELPILCEWKMPCKGFYVVGLEPGNDAHRPRTAPPAGSPADDRRPGIVRRDHRLRGAGHGRGDRRDREGSRGGQGSWEGSRRRDRPSHRPAAHNSTPYGACYARLLLPTSTTALMTVSTSSSRRECQLYTAG